MVTAAAGSVALVVAPLVKDHGVEYLLPAVLLAGIVQIAFGALGLARLARFIPRSVMLGFVNALGILIFVAQVPHLIDVPWVVLPPLRAHGGDRAGAAALHEGGALTARGDHRGDRGGDDRRAERAECRRRGRDRRCTAGHHAPARAAQPRHPAAHLADRAQHRVRRPSSRARHHGRPYGRRTGRPVRGARSALLRQQQRPGREVLVRDRPDPRS